VNQAMLRLIGTEGGAIDRIYFCPHSYAESCTCRKPKPGMILRACREFQVDPGDCFLIGDSEVDRSAGEAAGVRCFIIGQSAADFEDAVESILATRNALLSPGR
jgi:histidinol-phosphate phosphatase family protein